jgi:hypothetical protein
MLPLSPDRLRTTTRAVHERLDLERPDDLARGLGTAWTTLPRMHAEQASKRLGIPYAALTPCALIPVAHAKGGRDFEPGPRKPLAGALHPNGW